MLATVQAWSPRSVIRSSQALSHLGEHGAIWVAAGCLGWLLDRRRRGQWVWVALAPLVAHAVSVVVKRVVRRPRPDHASIAVHASTPSRLSFPSSHATSTTAGALLLGRMVGIPGLRWLPVVMGFSRLVLGVHYPTDVLAGTALGSLTASIATRAGRLPDGTRR